MHEAAGPALLSVIIVSVLSFVGAVTLALGPARLRGVIPFLVAVSAGALLGDAFLHLLPEATAHHGGFGGTVAWYTLGGVLGFFLVESVIHWHHHGEDVHEHVEGRLPSLAWMNLLGDGVHNLVDGMLIGGTWMVSPEAGMATTLAVALHEIPQEFGDFGVLLHAGVPVKRALFYNALSASVAIFGAVLILVVGSGLGIEPYLGPIAAGGFIYVACADLVPELHKRAKGKQVVLSLAAITVGLLVVTTLPAMVGGHTHHHPAGGHGCLDDHDEGEGHDGHDEDEGHDGHDEDEGHDGHDEDEGHDEHDDDEGHDEHDEGEGHDDDEGHDGHDEGHDEHDE